jgi:hypothetical protein
MLPLQIEITRFHKAFERGESRSAIEGRIQAIVADLMETAPASLGQICKELAPLELTSAAKNSLYQTLSPASSPTHIAMYHQCNAAIEDFADHFNVVCREVTQTSKAYNK